MFKKKYKFIYTAIYLLILFACCFYYSSIFESHINSNIQIIFIVFCWSIIYFVPTFGIIILKKCNNIKYVLLNIGIFYPMIAGILFELEPRITLFPFYKVFGVLISLSVLIYFIATGIKRHANDFCDIIIFRNNLTIPIISFFNNVFFFIFFEYYYFYKWSVIHGYKYF